MYEEMNLVPYARPELRTGSLGDWWAIGKLESSVQNSDGSYRTFSVEVGVSLTPHGDYQHAEADYWQLVAQKLPQIARQIARQVEERPKIVPARRAGKAS